MLFDTDESLETYVEDILSNIDSYTSDNSDFVYVFSPDAADEDALQGDWMNLETQVGYDVDGAADFKKNMGNNGIKSPFQDGAYIYLVIAGSGSGSTAKAPI